MAIPRSLRNLVTCSFVCAFACNEGGGFENDTEAYHSTDSSSDTGDDDDDGSPGDSGGDDSGDDSDGEPDDTGGGELPPGNGQIVPTRTPNVQLLSGIHALMDKSMPRCVETVEHGVDGAPYTVGSVSDTFELVYIASREDLARELEIDLSFKIRYVGKGGGFDLDLLDRFAATNRSVNLLLKARKDYLVTNRLPVRLNFSGADKLAQGAGPFVQTCGSHFANSVRYGGTVNLLITYTASDEETAHAIRSGLGFDIGGTSHGFNGSLETLLTEYAKLGNVSVSLRASSQGFDLGGVDLANLIASGVTPETFTQIETIRSEMSTSIQNDACRDAGEANCDHMPGPGYYDNTQRKAVSTGVSLGDYETLPNATWAGDNPFAAIDQQMVEHSEFISEYAQLQERMEAVYWRELDKFLTAPPANKPVHNVMPPGEALRSPTDIHSVANAWKDLFYPEVGPQVGDQMGEVIDVLVDCWNGLDSDLFHPCTPPAKEAWEMDAWIDADAALTSYRDTGRVLPLNVKLGTQPQPFDKAEDYCRDQFNSEQVKYRLPFRSELPLLDPVVGWGPVEWNGTAAHEIWFTDVGESNCGGWDPWEYYSNNPSDLEPSFACGNFWRQLSVVCVPTSGPVPLVSDP